MKPKRLKRLLMTGDANLDECLQKIRRLILGLWRHRMVVISASARGSTSPGSRHLNQIAAINIKIKI
jgi:hypothetical protein